MSRSEPLTNSAECSNFGTAYIWYDYFGVPQLTCRNEQPGCTKACPELQAAVDSIPAYIELCEHFFILVPPCQHTDLPDVACNRSSWSGRGWCRTEQAVRVLTSDPKRPSSARVLQICSEMSIMEVHPMGWLFALPHMGEFSVLADCKVVTEVMRDIFDRRIDHLRKIDAAFDLRFLLASRRHLSSDPILETDVNLWLSFFDLLPVNISKPLGWGAMHFAALEGNLEVLKGLLVRGARVDKASTKRLGHIMCPARMTPLMLAAFYIPDPQTNQETCAGLLHMRANLFLKNAMGETSLHCAAASPAGAETIRLLVNARADIRARDQVGNTSLHTAVTVSSTTQVPKVANIRALLELGAPVLDTNYLGMTPFYLAATGSSHEVHCFLAARADPNQQCRKTTLLKIVVSALRAKQRFRPGSATTFFLLEQLTSTPGSTPLHMAASSGFPENVRLLLDARADPTLRDANQHRPLDRLFGTLGRNLTTHPTSKLLEEAMAVWPYQEGVVVAARSDEGAKDISVESARPSVSSSSFIIEL